MHFKYTINETPSDGKALTGTELEEALLAELKKAKGARAESWWNLARFYQMTGNHRESQHCIDQIMTLEKRPEELAACFLASGQLAECRDDFEFAADQYRQALALEPSDTDTWYFIHNNLGYSLLKIGRVSDAVSYLELAAQIDPDRANAYKNLGLCQQSLGNYPEAAMFYVSATQVNASDDRSLGHLEELMEGHPELAVDLPRLPDQIEACRAAVYYAHAQQAEQLTQPQQNPAEQPRKWSHRWN